MYAVKDFSDLHGWRTPSQVEKGIITQYIDSRAVPIRRTICVTMIIVGFIEAMAVLYLAILGYLLMAVLLLAVFICLGVVICVRSCHPKIGTPDKPNNSRDVISGVLIASIIDTNYTVTSKSDALVLIADGAGTECSQWLSCSRQLARKADNNGKSGIKTCLLVACILNEGMPNKRYYVGVEVE